MNRKWRIGLIGGLLALILVFAGTAFFLRGNFSNGLETTALSLPKPPLVDQSELDTLLLAEAIPAIDDPQFELAGAAADVGDEEQVIAVEINGDLRAYPLTILSTHEIVNDTVGGQNIAVTWCPLCYSALVFDRQVNEQTLSFGVSGKLLHNTLIMVDRQTGTLWSQLYAGAINGKLAGASLSVYPSALTDWQSWSANNPNGLVLSKQKTCQQFDCGTYADNPRGSYAVDPYSSYYLSVDEGVVDRQIPREMENRGPKKRLLGVRLNGAARAYPYSLSSHSPVINDNLAGVPIVIWFNPNSFGGAAYHRVVGNEVLTFKVDPEDPTLLRDQETNSQWVGSSGKGKTGIYQQRQLTPLVYTTAFEFGWFGYFPHSETYGAK